MSVGNIASTARGSGARFNDGKAKLEYIPAEIIYDFYGAMMPKGMGGPALQVLAFLADFERGDNAAIYALLDALPADLVWRDTAAQFHFGAEKYAPWNWAKGMAWSIPIACIKRHCIAALEGERDDPESGVSHFGAVGCNAVMLAHYLRHFKEGDDRPALLRVSDGANDG